MLKHMRQIDVKYYNALFAKKQYPKDAIVSKPDKNIKEITPRRTMRQVKRKI